MTEVKAGPRAKVCQPLSHCAALLRISPTAAVLNLETYTLEGHWELGVKDLDVIIRIQGSEFRNEQGLMVGCFGTRVERGSGLGFGL